MSPSPDEKCIWCNGADGELTTIEVPVANQFPAGGVQPRREEVHVHPRHESETREFTERVHRQGGIFIVVMAFVPFLLVVPVALTSELAGAGSRAEYWIGVVGGGLLLLLGFFAIRYPFATPRTVEWIGIRRSILLVRATAGGAVAAGMGLIATNLL